MAKSPFALITEKQAYRLQELVYMDNDALRTEFSGVAGEIALRCAQARDSAGWRTLHKSLGAMLALIEFFACIDENAGVDIPTSARGCIERIKIQCEAGEPPSLLLDDNAFDDQWGG